MTADVSPVALVSGGTRGIGLELCRRLVKLGYQVVALYRGGSAAAEQAQRELGDAFTGVRADVRDPAAVRAATDQVISRYGAVRVLVNNAGINVDKPFLELTLDDWQRVLDTNLTGVFVLTQAVVPMMDGPDPVIVNIGATTGIRPRPNGANYCASKAGLLQLTKCLALELAPRIRVNCLIPGMTETEELVTRYRLDDPDARARVLAEIPARRLGAGSDIANAFEFLIGPQSTYMTGQKVIVDGGQFMW
jgi:3-oxoacyl-[acyl-carrier protein] reductase